MIAKSAETHPAAEKCCGWEEPAIYVNVFKHRHDFKHGINMTSTQLMICN